MKNKQKNCKKGCFVSFSFSTSRVRCYHLLLYSVEDFEVSVLRQHSLVSGDVYSFHTFTQPGRFLSLSYPKISNVLRLCCLEDLPI